MTRIGQQWPGGICDSCVFIIRVNMLTSYLIMHYHIVYFLLSTVCGNDEFLVCEKGGANTRAMYTRSCSPYA